MSRLVALLIFVLAGVVPLQAEPAPSPEVVRDLAPKGRLRAAINFGNGVLVQKAANGEPHGVSPALARAIAQRLGVPIEFVAFPSAGATFKAASTDAWDVAFIAIDPARATTVDFTPPYVLIQGAYMVRRQAPFRTIADFDKPGVSVCVGLGSIYDLYLTRTLKNARLVRNPKGGAAGGIEPFLAQSLDAAAGVREPLDAYVHDHSDMRVLPGSFEEIRQAVATPKNRGAAGLAWLRQFVEARKADGFVAGALKHSGQTAPVAPPEK